MQRHIHPLHAVILAGAVPLFLGALLGDLAYFSSHEIQWKNFASWLLVGGLSFCGLALLWALVGLVRAGVRDRRAVVYCALLLATWLVGFVDELVHAGDAWASMPGGLILSVIATLLMVAATWAGFWNPRAGAAP